ncbi:MAG TPA: hypothetical protein VKZ96_05895 [Thermomicrobiales bacterium]|nr:hypothetical protein [Thermomicrobiales bacterium]
MTIRTHRGIDGYPTTDPRRGALAMGRAGCERRSPCPDILASPPHIPAC